AFSARPGMTQNTFSNRLPRLELRQRCAGCALARSPRPGHGPPQGLVFGLAGKPDTIVQRLLENGACGLTAGPGARERAAHPSLAIPTTRVAALDCRLDAVAEKLGEPADRKVDHRRLTLVGQRAAEAAPHVDQTQRGAGHVGENRSGAFAA